MECICQTSFCCFINCVESWNLNIHDNLYSARSTGTFGTATCLHTKYKFCLLFQFQGVNCSVVHVVYTAWSPDVFLYFCAIGSGNCGSTRLSRFTLKLALQFIVFVKCVCINSFIYILLAIFFIIGRECLLVKQSQ